MTNRVTRYGDHLYRYDAHGRLEAKQGPVAGHQFFTWNDEHQMVGSASRQGEWTYHYDALGRRIAKRRMMSRQRPVAGVDSICSPIEHDLCEIAMHLNGCVPSVGEESWPGLLGQESAKDKWIRCRLFPDMPILQRQAGNYGDSLPN